MQVLDDRTVPSSVSGTLVNDANSNSFQDTGEAVLENRILILDTNRNSVLDAGETTLLTGPDGAYSFIITNKPPAQVGSTRSPADYVGLVLETGTSGLWLNTKATSAQVVRDTEPDAVRNFGVFLQETVGFFPSGSESLVNTDTAGERLLARLVLQEHRDVARVAESLERQ